MKIRPEEPADIEAITDVTVAAFLTLPISNNTEQFIIKALREAKALTVSLVAESDGQIIGHIAFSPVSVSDGSSGWFGLGPLSVDPDFHRQGIGKALIKEGINRLKALNAQGCFVVGDPKYYQQSGFVHSPDVSLEGVPPYVFLALAFYDHVPHGSVTFHPGFSATH